MTVGEPFVSGFRRTAKPSTGILRPFSPSCNPTWYHHGYIQPEMAANEARRAIGRSDPSLRRRGFVDRRPDEI
jgi:hypothetical protein